jgi:hypothetical protein
MAFEYFQATPILYIPYPHSTVMRRGEDAAMIGAPFNVSDGIAVAFEHLKAASRLNVPQPNAARTRKDTALILAPCQALYMIVVRFDDPEAAFRRDIPHPNSSIARSRDGALSIRA